MEMPYFYSRSTAPVRRAQLRRDDGVGNIVESVVPDPGLHYKEAEAAMLDAAKVAGVTASDKTIDIRGDPAKPKDRGLVSFPGKPARAKTRRDSN